MATATVARPAQALRQRDRAPRPSLAKRSTNVDGNDAPAKRRRLNEPYVRDSSYILRKHKGKPPSIVIHLHNTHFRFDGQEGSFAYDSPMKFVLEHLRKQTVPHEMLEELLSQNVPFYDGCLIVEVHNHKTKEGKEKGKKEDGAGPDSKFSMHAYNEHITPSPFAPFPSKARTDNDPEKGESSSAEMAAPEKPGKAKDKDKEGPKIFTTVLHPTALTQHHEMLLLASTPASDLRSKKKNADSGTPSTAQPPTPGLSVPPTPITTSRGPLSQPQKMCLEEGDFYSFQADVLLATEPPLFLDPVTTPQDADRVLEMLAHPLHNAKPPSPKTRKRTTAEMAADDAQAAEAERRMLIMDERIKPSARGGAGATANETQGAAAALGFSRFKTLEMVRQKHEEQERVRKDEEARVAMEKKHNDEQLAARQQQATQQQQQVKQREMTLAHQQQALVQRNMLAARQEQARQQQLEQARQAQMAREHSHPQPTPMMPNAQPNNFQHPTSMPQGSPVMRQPTPMMNSSPMMPQGGFPMAPNSSQGAGSPPRPTSAAMNRNVAMARQASQQQNGSQHNTPQMPQGTPSMTQVAPNRQMTQTPRMPPGSPAPGMQGTPTSASVQIHPTPQMGHPNQLTPEQVALLQQRHTHMTQGTAHAGSPGGVPNMTPEQFQQINAARMQQQQQLRAQQHAMIAAQQAGNHQQANQIRMQAAATQQRMNQQMNQMRQMQHLQQMGQAGSPGPQQMGGGHPQQTPQMGHAHPQTPHQQQPGGGGMPNMQPNGGPMATQEQIAQAQAKSNQLAIQRAQQQLGQIAQQYGGWMNIPPNIAQSLPPIVQQLLQRQHTKHRQLQQQQHLMRQQQLAASQQAGGEQVPAGPTNPQYMQTLRANQALLYQQMHGQGQPQGGGVNMNGMGGMGQQQQQNFGGQQSGGGNNLDQHFANMHNALNRGQSQGGMQ